MKTGKNTKRHLEVRHARCKHVLAILLNRLETLELIREEVHPPHGDFATEASQLVVVRWYGIEVSLPVDCVVFLGDQPHAEGGRQWGLTVLAMRKMHATHGKRKNDSMKRTQELPAEVEDALRFISENMKLSGFSGTITPKVKEHALKLYRQKRLRRKPPLFRQK
jgi:hypothetical protein